MIELSQVNKFFHQGKEDEVHAMKDLTLHLPDQGFVALLGPSASGKTTLLNAMGGLDNITSGSVLVNGELLPSKAKKADALRALTMGYLFQDEKLVEDKTVFDNVALALKLVGVKDKNELNDRITAILAKVGMEQYKTRSAASLSDRERQRVALARALVTNPDVILADEPVGTLGANDAAAIMNILKSFSKDKLVVLFTQNPQFAKAYADRIIGMEDGQIIKDLDNVSVSLKDETLSNLNPEGVTFDQPIFIEDEETGDILEDYVEPAAFTATVSRDQSLSNAMNTEKKYSSTTSLWSAFVEGFRKIFHYSIPKLVSLLFLLFTGFCLIFSSAQIGASLQVTESDFVKGNNEYLQLDKTTLSADEYTELANREEVKYILPGDGVLNFSVSLTEEETDAVGPSLMVSGVATPYGDVVAEDLVAGRLPENTKEIVVDRMIVDRILEDGTATDKLNFVSITDLLECQASLQFGMNFTIVGISDTQQPLIFMDDNQFTWAFFYNNAPEEGFLFAGTPVGMSYAETDLASYQKQKKYYTVASGMLPEKDFTCMVNETFKEDYPLGSTVKETVAGQELEVVGYYKTTADSVRIMVNDDMLALKMAADQREYQIVPNGKLDAAFSGLDQAGYNILKVADQTKKAFEAGNQIDKTRTILLAAIVLLLSLVLMFFLLFASVRSRKKEIGALRGLGVKKGDVKKQSAGEILALTTLTELPAMVITYIVLACILANNEEAGTKFFVVFWMLLAAIAGVYILNLIVGMIPTWHLLRKRPAELAE